MRITQLRNATMLIAFGEHHWLVDPMLSEPGSLPGFKLVGESDAIFPASRLRFILGKRKLTAWLWTASYLNRVSDRFPKRPTLEPRQ
jgi:hypothetical protein